MDEKIKPPEVEDELDEYCKMANYIYSGRIEDAISYVQMCCGGKWDRVTIINKLIELQGVKK